MIPESVSGKKCRLASIPGGDCMGERDMEEKERRGKLGAVTHKNGDHFRMAPDREGFREEIRPVV